VPRPSSPVYAKASTNCPYLTLENPHHQRQIWNSVVVGVPGTFTRSCGPRAPPVAAPPRRGHSQLDNLVCNSICLSRSAGEPPDRKEAHAATASISRTHSQCQRGATAPRFRGRSREDLVFISGNLWQPLHRFRGSGSWWSQTGSNRRPQACKASALPTELWPRRTGFPSK
jgi:hypothetical protein